MASLNKTKPKKVIRTAEGAVAKRINPEQQLRRSVMACMLWEKTAYESGESVASRIAEFVPKVKPEVVAQIAIDAREKMNLRHVPLLLVREMARHKDYKYLVRDTLSRVIQRPDEITEFLALYWKDGRCPLAASVKKGIARAFNRFNEYSLAKYNRDGAVKLRDALFLCHAKPEDKKQEKLWSRLIEGELKTPDTWEVALSAGEDKGETFARLIEDKKLGGLALLRNLRNMQEAKVPLKTIRNAISEMKTDRVLPFRFIAAANYAPKLEPELETAMLQSVAGHAKLPGNTVLLVDVSGSMDNQLSSKSEMRRIDAACGLAVLLREVCESVEIFSFSDNTVAIKPRKGFALRDELMKSQKHNGTNIREAIAHANYNTEYDRVIVITDEQAANAVHNPIGRGYMINVSTEKNGIGYGAWTHIDGFSDAVVSYIAAIENED